MKFFNFHLEGSLRNFFRSARAKEWLVILGLVLISAFAHGYNMFNFPYYENDEGVYLSQAWSLINQGQLAPYTYWYDHAPAGWIFLSFWIKLTGGFFTFGNAINSGRAFMLVLHLITALLLFFIGKKLSGSLFPGIIAVLIFSLSPLAIYFQRRVLLDNIMIFWVALSFSLLLVKDFRLSALILSAVTFGIAVLTKEIAIYFLPAFIYVLLSREAITHKFFTLAQWSTASALIISTYFLYALLRGELFPMGFLGSSQPHVSLLSSLLFQFTRGGGYPFWNPHSDFYINLQGWLGKDPFTVTLGAAATIISFLLMVKVKQLRIPALLAAVFWIFLIRARLIIDFYVIPAIPLLSLNLGVLLDFLFKQFGKLTRNLLQLTSLAIILAGMFYLSPLNPYTRNETQAQIAAIDWVKANLPAQAYIVIDNYAFIDLRESKSPGDKAFPNADWFWKLDYDPAVRDQKYGRDWGKIEYIILSHEMIRQMRFGTQKTLKKAFDNSRPIILWRDQSIAYVDFDKYISTNGDWMAIFKLNEKPNVALNQSWEFFKKNFIVNYGQVIDPTNNDLTTSEGQAYTMLRAVWENDQTTFREIWQWTKDHLQHRLQDKLLSWNWQKEGDEYKLGDWASAADADEDIALALLFASKQWQNQAYQDEAKEIIKDIWRQEVREINGRYFIISGTDKEKREGFLINPSYFSPATYKIFAEVDKSHPWKKLVDDGYRFLETLGQYEGDQTYLPPNWVIIDSNGNLKSAAKYVPKDPDLYGYDAFRTFWRVAVDALWFKERRATAYLKKAKPFFDKEWKEKGQFSALYDLKGQEKAPYNSLSTDVGALSIFTITDQKLAKQIYEKFFDQKFNHDEGYWSNAKDYYDQNWGWFGSGLYSGDLTNLWKTNP
ncbi:MAG TPA: glycosyl hydrolase family 8 [Patescibacteria group bacterium]|nr:glycosyl hydrolase family 8 [Patescibacteria group bacterium]